MGNDAEKELVCFLLTIPIFIGYYALFVLVCHGIKTGLYAFFKSHRKEWNSIADREEMEEHIVQNLGQIQKKAQEKTTTITNTKNAAPIADDTPKRESNVESHSPEEVSVTPEALAKLQLKRDIQKAHDELEAFINQVQIDRKQMNEAKVAREAKKLDAILKYTRYTLMPDGFTDEELYQIEEAVKLLVELNTKYTVLQMDGLLLKMEGRSRELFETLFARMKELPAQVDKAAAAGMEKSIKRLDDEITKVKKVRLPR